MAILVLSLLGLVWYGTDSVIICLVRYSMDSGIVGLVRYSMDSCIVGLVRYSMDSGIVGPPAAAKSGCNLSYPNYSVT